MSENFYLIFLIFLISGPGFAFQIALLILIVKNLKYVLTSNVEKVAYRISIARVEKSASKMNAIKIAAKGINHRYAQIIHSGGYLRSVILPQPPLGRMVLAVKVQLPN